MKRMLNKTIITILFVLTLISFNASHARASEMGITIDGYYDDWSDKPYSWEYTWDNPYIIYHYWDGTQNITKEYRDENGNPYNLEIRHKMSLYCDGEYVYLHILISSNPGAGLHGEDFRFYIDNRMAAFRITYAGGDRLNKNDNHNPPGNYYVEVRHRDGGMSNSVVEGATACFTKKENDLNNEIEIKIPLTAMKEQDDRINIEDFNTIEFFTPNLMYRRIACSGVSTGPYVGIALSMAFAGGVYILRKRKVRGSRR